MAASETRRLIASLAGMYYRRDRGELTGRNSEAGDRDLDAKWSRLQAALEAGGYEELDANPRLAAKYAKLERRHVLGSAS